KTICIFVRFFDFSHVMKRKTYQNYFNSGLEIFEKTVELFGKNLLPLSKKVRLVGVSVSGLYKITTQGYLLEKPQKTQNLIKTVDEINSKYGEFTIKPLSMKIAENFGILDRCGVLGSRTWKSSKYNDI
ncbi:MAG TPA: hypothetical protein PLF61_03225, partial [Candidatus Goldiibacteriota bacterium]|nr:hypothetical protein [Candidatus Goldiibacteriota bacterium]